MNAQRLSNDTIAIGNGAIRKDAIETIEDIKVNEFYRLVKCTILWSSKLNDKRDIMFAPAPVGSKLRKEFDSICQRRKLYDEKMNIFITNGCHTKPQEGNKTIDNTNKHVNSYKSCITGTSRLIYLKNKNAIIIKKKKHPGDSYNRLDAVCITNAMRDEFIKDSKSIHSAYKKNFFEIRKSNNEDLFLKWLNIVEDIYNIGLENNNKVTSNGESLKDANHTT